MGNTLIKLYDENPSEKQIKKIVNCLSNGGLIIYPTDTIYGIGCDIFNHKAIEKIAQIKNVDPKNNNFSFICQDLSQVSEFTKPIDNSTFKLMKRLLPGPYTFVLEANNNVPNLFQNRKKSVGVRIPDNSIILMIVRELGHPILTTSLPQNDEDYPTDPELIYEEFGDLVDIVIDGGDGNNIPSTILDCTSDEIKVIRQGLGLTDFLE
jgi:tRNA threonylcarbamoyl adenosine modification protein (Sua5/YciO/YrdC/YwlC family)